MSTPTLIALDTAIKFKDYSAYRFRAEVDWIELRIITVKPTNFQTVKWRLNVPYVEALNADAGGAATVFKTKFQSPRCWAEVNERIQCLAEDHQLAEPIKVERVEIAFDAYSKALSRPQLVEMALQFYRAAQKLVSTNRRVSKTKRDRSTNLLVASEVKTALTDGFNIYIGEESDAERQHIYVKETDAANPLPLDQQRARTEFTLAGQKITEPMFNAWMEHDFTQFAPYFKFRQLKNPLPPSVAHARHMLAQYGECRPRRVPNGNTRLFSSSTTADAKLNALAFDALRELTRRWKAKA